jgi:hypothetical protein
MQCRHLAINKLTAAADVQYPLLLDLNGVRDEVISVREINIFPLLCQICLRTFGIAILHCKCPTSGYTDYEQVHNAGKVLCSLAGLTD